MENLPEGGCILVRGYRYAVCRETVANVGGRGRVAATAGSFVGREAAGVVDKQGVETGADI
jgi:hypothetical protein